MMHNILLLLLLCIAFPTLGQQDANSSIERKIQDLQNYDHEPIYQVHVESPYAFSILINGIPIANKNAAYPSDYIVQINNCIPNSGKQSIEIFIYPRYTVDNKQNNFMEKDVPFILSIEKTNWQNGLLTEPEVVFQYELPTKDYSQVKQISYSGDFKAKVPYLLTDWRIGNTVDVRDSVAIKAELLQRYKNLKYSFENQQGSKYINDLSLGLYNLYQSSYLSQEQALKHLKHKEAFINSKTRELLNLEDYRLEISTNGKLLSLRRIDGYNSREGILRRTYKKGPKEMVQVDDIIFYSPTKGKYEIVWFNNLVKSMYP
ncbi:hypothetical protein ACYSNM_11430 [Myroides sp. LJL116]